MSEIDPTAQTPTFWHEPAIRAALEAGQVGVLFRALNMWPHAYTQEAIGRAVDMEQTRVSKIIHGKNKVKEQHVKKRIADGLDMPDHARQLFGLASAKPEDANVTVVASVADSANTDNGSPLTLTADIGMDQPLTRDGSLAIISDWVHAGLIDRRSFLAISGTTLTAVATGTLPKRGPLAAALAGHSRVSHPLLDQIESTVPQLQRLDDAAGGGTHLTYVGTQFKAIATLLHHGGHTDAIESRLYAALVDIGQLCGWMAFDAGDHGLAQRYFLTARHAAQIAGYSAMEAHILADLAFQAATNNNPGDAVAIGEAAQRAATHTPAAVRASVESRLGYGYAISGRTADADRTHQHALDALAADRGGPAPEWMYYLTDNHLDSQAGYALIHAGVLASSDKVTSQRLLQEGRNLLVTGAHARPLDAQNQRRAQFEGAWLAVADAHLGDLESAVVSGSAAVSRSATVQSARANTVLTVLASQLAKHRRNPQVRDFLPHLKKTLQAKVNAPR